MFSQSSKFIVKHIIDRYPNNDHLLIKITVMIAFILRYINGPPGPPGVPQQTMGEDAGTSCLICTSKGTHISSSSSSF